MKRIAIALLAALGMSSAVLAYDVDASRQNPSYEQVAAGEALPAGESAYGYSTHDPYTE